MSQAHGHATAPAQSAQAPEMGISSGGQKIAQRSEQETITSKEVEVQRHKNKQNLNYVLKSGLAGGLAGCAVRFPAGSTIIHRTCLLISSTGQNSRRSSRSCQDPLSSLEPPVCEIHGLLVRRCYGYERHQPTRRHARSIPRSLSNTPSNLSLRWHKIPGLRTNSLDPHPDRVSRNTFTAPPLRLPRRRHLGIFHLPPRSHPCPPRIRNEERFPLLPIQHMPPDLPRVVSQQFRLAHTVILSTHRHSLRPQSQSRKLLPRFLPHPSRHGTLRRHVLPHPRHRRRPPPPPPPRTLHHHPLPPPRSASPSHTKSLGLPSRRRSRRSRFPNRSIPSRGYPAAHASRWSDWRWASAEDRGDGGEDLSGAWVSGVLGGVDDWVC